MKQALESLRSTVGLWSPGMEAVAPSQLKELLGQVEQQGWPVLWYPESYGREAFTAGALALAASTKLKLATGIANIHGRDPIAASSAARSLNAAYPDRFITGLGVSHRPIVERLRGHEYAKPLEAMRSYLEAMAAASPFMVEANTEHAVVIAALGPKMLELAATNADGALPYLVTPEHTATARPILGESFLAVEQAVVLTSDHAVGLERAHRHLHIYTGLDNYRASWRRLGFGDEDFVPGGSDRLAEAMVTIGSAEQIAQRVVQHREAGADHVCLQVLGEDGISLDLEATAEIREALT